MAARQAKAGSPSYSPYLLPLDVRVRVALTLLAAGQASNPLVGQVRGQAGPGTAPCTALRCFHSRRCPALPRAFLHPQGFDGAGTAMSRTGMHGHGRRREPPSDLRSSLQPRWRSHAPTCTLTTALLLQSDTYAPHPPFWAHRVLPCLGPVLHSTGRLRMTSPPACARRAAPHTSPTPLVGRGGLGRPRRPDACSAAHVRAQAHTRGLMLACTQQLVGLVSYAVHGARNIAAACGARVCSFHASCACTAQLAQTQRPHAYVHAALSFRLAGMHPRSQLEGGPGLVYTCQFATRPAMCAPPVCHGPSYAKPPAPPRPAHPNPLPTAAAAGAADIDTQALSLVLLLKQGATHQLLPKLAAYVASPGGGSRPNIGLISWIGPQAQVWAGHTQGRKDARTHAHQDRWLRVAPLACRRPPPPSFLCPVRLLCLPSTRCTVRTCPPRPCTLHRYGCRLPAWLWQLLVACRSAPAIGCSSQRSTHTHTPPHQTRSCP